MVPVSRRSSRPSETGSRSQRAVSARSACACPNSSASPSVATAPGHDPVQPRRHLVRGLASGARVRPDRPAGHRLPDLVGGDPFVGPVGPLGQVLVHLGGREPRELCGTARALPRRGQHQRERRLGQPRPQGPGGVLTRGGERQLRGRRVPAGQAPLGGTVPDQPDVSHESHARGRRAPTTAGRACRDRRSGGWEPTMRPSRRARWAVAQSSARTTTASPGPIV